MVEISINSFYCAGESIIARKMKQSSYEYADYSITD